tara:strand:- start:138 stop:569 length:432 start_codon:yes stop_codon:yes gene_type:complete
MSSGCGFKVLESLETYNLNITELNTVGDKRINFKIKNSLTVESNDNDKINLSIDLSTIKEKSIKEKSIKNKITKYKISISSNVKLFFSDKALTKEFNVISSGDYLTSGQYSATLQNEKKLVKDLTEDIIAQINNKILLIVNDF